MKYQITISSAYMSEDIVTAQEHKNQDDADSAAYDVLRNSFYATASPLEYCPKCHDDLDEKQNCPNCGEIFVSNKKQTK